MIKGKGLMDILTHQVGASYISDLSTEKYRKELVECIKKLDSKDYPLGEWLDVLDYLVGEKARAEDTEVCKERLLQLL